MGIHVIASVIMILGGISLVVVGLISVVLSVSARSHWVQTLAGLAMVACGAWIAAWVVFNG